MGYKFRKTQLGWKNYKYIEKFVLKSSKGEKIWATEWGMGGNIYDLRKIRCGVEEWVKSPRI